MQNDVCAEGKNPHEYTSILCIPLERLWSLFTFYLGGIAALHFLRKDFGAKLCNPLGTTLELLHLLFRWHLSSASPYKRLWSFFTFNLVAFKLCIPLGMTLELRES
jgi:hypothetical protein